MFKTIKKTLDAQNNMSLLAVGALGLCLVGGGIAVGQTKQLKSSTSAPQVVEEDLSANSNSQVIVNAPNGNSSSYSVVIENKTTPDGKVVQSKKVWQNGQLVSEEEKTLDADEAQNGLNATIQLPNGQVAPGGLFSSDEDDFDQNFFPSSPFDAIRQMEEQMKAQHERMRAQFEALRQQMANDLDPSVSNLQSGVDPDPNAQNQQVRTPSKYWIGTTIEAIPEFLLAQLPLEENQGVWIQFVASNSPAAKAGLKRYDVLYKLGDELASSPADVSKIVEKIGAKKITVEYYRKGQLQKAELSIEERPKNALAGGVNNLNLPRQNKNFRVVRPGLIVPSDNASTNDENSASTQTENKDEQKSEEAEMESNKVEEPAPMENAAVDVPTIDPAPTESK